MEQKRNVSLWVPYRNFRLAGKYRCIRQSQPMEPGVYEFALIGELGEIFENSDNPERRYKVMFYTGRTAAKHGLLGPESSTVFPESQLDQYFKAINGFFLWRPQLRRVQELYGYTCLDPRFRKQARKQTLQNPPKGVLPPQLANARRFKKQPGTA